MLSTAETKADDAGSLPEALMDDTDDSVAKYTLESESAPAFQTRVENAVNTLTERAQHWLREPGTKEKAPAPAAAPAPAPVVDPRRIDGARRSAHTALRLPPSPTLLVAPPEQEQPSSGTPPPLTLQELAPNPLSVTYASSLRPLQTDPSRRVMTIGQSGGSVHQRSARKAGARLPSGKGKGGQAHADLWKWSVRARASPSAGLVRKASKCLLTRDWKVAFTEQKFVKAMARIDQLKSQGHWSFRQPKRIKGPVERKTHRDYLLDEMRWLQTDFREERKWKLAVAYELAHQAVRWHKAKTPEERAALCVRYVRLSEKEMEVEEGEADADAEAKEAEEADADADAEASVEPEAKDKPEAEAEADGEAEPEAMDVDTSSPKPKPAADAKADEHTDVDADGSPGAEPTHADAEESDKDAEGEDDIPHDKPAGPGPTVSLDAPPTGASDAPMRAGADKDATLSDKLPLALVTAIRAPIFGLDATATSVSPWSLLHNLDPAAAAALLQVDERTALEALNMLEPEQLDLAKLFPELPQYGPLVPHDDSKHGEKRREEGSTTHPARIAHVTRLLDARPALVSTLNPATKRVHGEWRDLDEHSAPDAPDAQPWAAQPGSLLFARRAGKVSRDYALHTAVVPTPPAAPEARAAQLSWTSEDDVFLAALAKQYQDNWPLIADLFNSARLTLATERRTPWDCYDRCKWLQAEADVSSTDDALRGKRPAPKPEGARKKQHRSHLLEVMRKCAKRREQAQRQAAAAASSGAARRVNLSTHDTHTQVKSISTPTPQALSMLKAERDQAAIRQFFEQQRAAQLAYQQQQQQRLQMAQAQAQAQTGTPDHPPSPGKQEAPAPTPSQPSQSTPRPPNAPYMATLPNQNKPAMLLAQNNQVPFVRNATQPYFGLDPHNQQSYQTSSPVLAVRSPGATQAQLQQHFAMDKKPSPVAPSGTPAAQAQRQPIVIAASSPAQQQAALRARNPGAPHVRPMNYGMENQGQAYNGLPLNSLGGQAPTPPVAVRQSASPGLPSTPGAPPNLHALQQQLAITLAASHLSQEQINSLAVQLYKQAQQQQRPPAPDGQAPFQAGVPRYVPMAQNAPQGHQQHPLNLAHNVPQTLGTPPRPPPSPHGQER